MEYVYWPNFEIKIAQGNRVLILILMEYVYWRAKAGSGKNDYVRLNPYSNGICLLAVVR